MASSVQLDILPQVDQLYLQLESKEGRIDSLSPRSQISAAADLKNDSLLLTEFQQTVEKMARGLIQMPTGFSNNDLILLSEKLTASAAILDAMEINNLIATECVDICPMVEDLHSQTHPNASAIRSLQERISNLMTDHSYLINRGNRKALDAAGQVLQAMLTQHNAGFVPNQPAIQNRTNRSSLIPPSLLQDQQIMKMQDEDYQASLFTDQYNGILTQISNDPLKDFEVVFTYYTNINAYSLSKTSYISQEARSIIANYLQMSEQLLSKIIEAQTKYEAEQVQQIQGQTAQGQVLIELKEAIAQALASGNLAPHMPKIDEIFRKLSSEQKKQLFIAVDEIQKMKTTRNMGIGLRGRDFSIWHASLTQKKQAVEEVLSALNGPEAPVIARHADEMNRRLLAVKNTQTALQTPSSTRPNQTPPRNSLTDFSSGMYLPDDADISTLGFEDDNNHQHSPTRPSQATLPSNQIGFPAGMYLPDDFDFNSLSFEDVVPSPLTISNLPSNSDIGQRPLIIQDLQALLMLLEPNASIQQLQEAYQALLIMESKGYKSVFKMSDMSPRSIGDRPCYHIYFIHKNESPENLRDDMQYGNKAFAGAYPATNEERLRAVQRTIVELTLESLENAINFDDGAALVSLLDVLEGIKLHARDRAQEQENAAYNLFAAFYHLHVTARSNNPSLIDPHLGFNGDFGRNAFSKTMLGIDPAIKIAAINNVRNDLKAAWKVR